MVDGDARPIGSRRELVRLFRREVEGRHLSRGSENRGEKVRHELRRSRTGRGPDRLIITGGY